MNPSNSGVEAVSALAGVRRPLAVILTVLALASLLGTVYFLNRALDARPADRNLEVADDAEVPEANPESVYRTDYILAAISLAMLTLALGSSGVPALGAVEKPSTEGKLRDTRRLILTGGGLTGLVLMVVGLGYFVYYFSEVTTWLNTLTPTANLYRPILALMTFVAGAGLAFVAVQPVRVEERNDPVTRRLVYGVNVVLTSLLLLATLVVVNVLVGLKVPNKIDTTVTGLYSYELAPATREFLERLDAPVKLYAVLSPPGDSPIADDARRMVNAMRETNPAQITVELLSPAINSERVRAVADRFPEFRSLADEGLIVTTGTDEAKYAVVGLSQLVEQSPAGAREFTGESKVLRELLFLAEDRVKPVVYVTTGHNELEVVPAPRSPENLGPRRPATGVRQALEKVYFDVRPLAFDPAKPEVPADASVVVVADPQTPLSPTEADALKTYLERTPAGKLLILSGPAVGAGNQLIDVGLNDLLAEVGLGTTDRFIAGQPTSRLTVKEHVVYPNEGGGPVALRLDEPVLFTNCRGIRRLTARDPALAFTAILYTQPGRLTWQESEVNADPEAVLQAMARNPASMRERQVSQSPLVVAASAGPADAPRVILFSTGDSFADRSSRGTARNPELVAVAVNALRERPVVADIAAKPYGVFTPSPATDVVKTVILPGLIAVLGTAALGFGVWMVRRR